MELRFDFREMLGQGHSETVPDRPQSQAGGVEFQIRKGNDRVGIFARFGRFLFIDGDDDQGRCTAVDQIPASLQAFICHVLQES